MNSKILWITHRSSIDNYAYPRCPFEVSMTPMRVDDFRPGSFLITALSTVRGRAARKVVKGGKKIHARSIHFRRHGFSKYTKRNWMDKRVRTRYMRRWNKLIFYICIVSK